MKRPTPAPVAHRKTNAKKKKGISPRLTHGTRVAFQVTCARCGTEDTLPFVPKNAEELLCSGCAETEYGEDWDKGRTERSTEYEFQCAACTKTAFVQFMPEEPDGFLCLDCVKGIETSDPTRLTGATKVGKKRGVMKRKPSD
jgi:CxxC-x17-CxxC domain-containing protein